MQSDMKLTARLGSIVDKNPIANPARLFLISGFLFGICMMLVTPPFQGPDEAVHFLRSAQIAKLDFTIDKNASNVGGQLDTANSLLIVKLLDEPKLPFNPDTKIDPDTILDANSIEFTNEDSFTEFGGTASNPPLVYLPSAAGIGVAKILNFSPLATFYAARFGGLLAWIAITYLAIKKIPTHKTALMIINFLPMLVFQVSVVTADTVSFALVSLFVANVVYLRSKKEDLSRKEWLILIGQIFLLSLSKRLYFVFVPLILLIRPLTNKVRNRAIQIAAIIVSVPISLFWGIAMEAKLGTVGLVDGGADPDKQIAFLTSDPLALKDIFQRTYLSDTSPFLYKSFIGNFGWVDTPLSVFVVIFSAIVLFLALSRASISKKAADEPFSKPLSKIEKLIWIAVASAYFLGVNFAIYIYFSPPMTNFFYGLQGRYFIPILLIAPIMFLKVKKHDSEKWISQKVLFISSQLVLVISLFVIAFRYYPIA